MMIIQRSSFVLLLLTGLLSVVCGGSLKGSGVAHDNDVANKPVDEDVKRRLAEALNNFDKMTTDHLMRKLQLELPAPFENTRACGETIGTVSIAELQALANLFIGALFQNTGDTALAGLATTTLLGQILYDMRLVKVCMSCAEAEALLPADVAGNSEDEYGFKNLCAEGSYAVDQAESALAYIPVDPMTGDIIAGAHRGLMYGRGATLLLADAPSVKMPGNWTQYLAETPVEEVLATNLDTLVPGIFSGSGATSIVPDFLGYGESYVVDRPFLMKKPYARSYVLSWLATREYIRGETTGCTDLEPMVTIGGYSEGGYSTIPGALALQGIGVTIRAAFPGGAPFQPSVQATFDVALLASGEVPDIAPELILFKRALTPYFAYAFSNEFPFLANTGTGQRVLLESVYQSPDITTNPLLWFQSPAQIGAGFLAFAPENPTVLLNQGIVASSIAAGAVDGDACVGEFVVNTTDKICEAIVEQNLITELESVDFPTVVCHSPDDIVVTIKNSPTFPFANPFVTEYTGIPILNILEPQGDHGVANVVCSISPILSLQVQGEEFPAKISPLENPPAVCLAPSSPPSTGPSTEGTGSKKTESPTASPTAASDSETDDETDDETGSGVGSFRLTATFMASVILAFATL